MRKRIRNVDAWAVRSTGGALVRSTFRDVRESVTRRLPFYRDSISLPYSSLSRVRLFPVFVSFPGSSLSKVRAFDRLVGRAVSIRFDGRLFGRLGQVVP